MNDYMVRAMAADAGIRAFALTARNLVDEMREIHHASPVATAALGRLLMGGAMMGAMMKGERDLLTIQIKGDGPIGGMTVTADCAGNVKGYANEPQILLPPSKAGKLDVGGAVGRGYMRVIKDIGMKEPYIGQVQLQTGEIAEDLTFYFASSEQVPSSVGLGVLMNKDNTVSQSGGFMIQLMPFADEQTITMLENNLNRFTSVTEVLSQGASPEELLEGLLGNMGLRFSEKSEVRYHCGCSRERVEKALRGIGTEEIQEMIADGKEIETNCHFCSRKFYFQIQELQDILKERGAGDCREV